MQCFAGLNSLFGLFPQRQLCDAGALQVNSKPTENPQEVVIHSVIKPAVVQKSLPEVATTPIATAPVEVEKPVEIPIAQFPTTLVATEPVEMAKPAEIPEQPVEADNQAEVADVQNSLPEAPQPVEVKVPVQPESQALVTPAGYMMYARKFAFHPKLMALVEETVRKVVLVRQDPRVAMLAEKTLEKVEQAKQHPRVAEALRMAESARQHPRVVALVDELLKRVELVRQRLA